MLSAILPLLLASAPGLDVSWTAPAGCPEQEAVARDIESLAGQPLSGLAEGTVVGRIEATPEGYRLDLELPGAQGQEHRSVEAAECQTLARAAALMVAVAVDPVATGETVTARLEAEPQPQPEPPSIEPLPPAEPAEPVVEPAPAPAEPPAPDEPLRPPRGSLGLGVSGGGAWGLTPGWTGGLEAEIGWVSRGVQVAAAGHHWFSQSTSVETGASLAAALSGATIRGCYAPSVAPMEFPLCAVVDLGALHGGGIGPSVTRRRDADLYVGVGFGVGANWVPRPRFALRARLEVVVAARQPGFHLNRGTEQAEAFRMEPVSVRLLLGPQLRLP